MEKYIRLSDVQELLKLIELRNDFFEGSETYKTYDERINNIIESLERDAITI